MKMKFKVSALAALTLISAGAIAQEVVNIGHVGPVSGAIAHLGKDNESGARLAIEELNAKGVKIGGICATHCVCCCASAVLKSWRDSRAVS